MELRQLEYFLAVARELSFTRAAEQLFVSQSSLSKQIAKLEEELHSPLFVRGSHGIYLTAAGDRMARSAPGIVNAWNSLCAQLTQSTLTLAVTPVLAHYGLTGRLTHFSREHPEVKLQIVECENSEAPGLLSSARAELAIFRMDGEEDPSLRRLTLRTDELALLIPRSHPSADDGCVSLSQFADEKFLLLGGGTHLQASISRSFSLAKVHPEIIFEGSNSDTIRDLVAGGAGIAILLGQVARRLAETDSRLSAVSFLETYPMELVLAARRSAPLSPQAKVLWRYLAASVPGER